MDNYRREIARSSGCFYQKPKRENASYIEREERKEKPKTKCLLLGISANYQPRNRQ